MIADETPLDPTSQRVRADEAPGHVTLDDVRDARWFAEVDLEVAELLGEPGVDEAKVLAFRAHVWVDRTAAPWGDSVIVRWAALRRAAGYFGAIHAAVADAMLAETERRLRRNVSAAGSREVLIHQALANHEYYVCGELPGELSPSFPTGRGEMTASFAGNFLAAQAEAVFWDAYRAAAPEWSGPLPAVVAAVERDSRPLPRDPSTPAEHGRLAAVGHGAAIGLYVESVTLRRVLVAAIAAERFRRSRGRWPDALEELFADGDLAAIDPMTDTPLRMVHEGESLVIYGVGVDRTDHGGELPVRGPSGRPRTPLGKDAWNETDYDVGVRLGPPAAEPVSVNGP